MMDEIVILRWMDLRGRLGPPQIVRGVLELEEVPRGSREGWGRLALPTMAVASPPRNWPAAEVREVAGGWVCTFAAGLLGLRRESGWTVQRLTLSSFNAIARSVGEKPMDRATFDAFLAGAEAHL
jgi:hypothetical protein